jgi:lipopolysaccharide/colanic/teichoic acid biosynthesis glycosyltransferase
MVRILFFCIQFVLFYLTIIFFIENKSILTLAPKIILINWLIAEILTQKFDLQLYQQKTKYIFSSFFNSYYILIFLNFIVFCFFNFNYDILWITFTYIILELIVFYFIIRFQLKNYKKPVNNSIAKHEQNDLIIDNQIYFNKNNFSSNINQNLLEFIAKNVSNEKSESENQNLLALNKNLLILKNRLNDSKDCNQTLLENYNQLENGGYLLVPFNNIEQTNELLTKKFGLFKSIIFPFHWLFYRLFSKIPFLDKFSNLITNHKNKVLSWVEVYGRLSFTGFDILDEISIDDLQYILARKVKITSTNPVPSFYLVVNLNRVSLFGNIIKVKKVRSMYPYSEFLQKRVFETNSLNNSGKFNNDPRITPAGKYIRKYWIDELPQLFEIIRGKIKLVGIRAMSQHFFSLYSKEYQELYLLTKPGFFSPIFDDNSSFQEIQKIEYQYLKEYKQNPIKTDIKYFLKTLAQIIKGTRSK